MIARIYGVYKFHFKEENLTHNINLRENPSNVIIPRVKLEIDIREIKGILESNSRKSKELTNHLENLHKNFANDKKTCKKLVK